MNKAFLTIGVVLMAIVGIYVVSFVTGQQTGAELDYYVLKETTEAAMNDAVDSAFYRKFGTLRMDKEKFMESFVKRFANSVDGTREYTISVYDINETPPKVSVKVTSPKTGEVATGLFSKSKETTDISTQVDMILEDKNKNNIVVETQNKEYARDLEITSVQ